MSGWDLLNLWKVQHIPLPPLLVFSSSPAPAEFQMAKENPQVNDFLVKLLKEEKIQTLILPYFKEG